MLATTYFTVLAAIAAPALGMVARGQDSSNFNRDTAPQGYGYGAASSAAPVYQISDGQVQNNPPVTPSPVPLPSPETTYVPAPETTEAAPPVYETSAVVPSSEVYPIPSVTSVVVPVPETTAELTVTPVIPVPVPTVPVTTVLTSAVSYPNSTLSSAVASGTGPAASATTSAPAQQTGNGAATLNAFGSMGLVAIAAAYFL